MGFKFFSSSGAQKTSATLTAPVGALMEFAGASAPDGWILCDGSEVSQTTYAELFSVIGATYNTGGEGVGNFRVPDFRGRVAVGPDGGAGRVTSNNTLASTSGAQSVALTTTELPTHTHGAGTLADPSHTHSAAGGNLKVGAHSHSHTLAAPAHTHTAGSYTMPDHAHGVGTFAAPGPATNELTNTTTGGTGARVNANHAHSITGSSGNLVSALITGTSGGASATALTGSISNSAGTENVTGTTDASGTGAVTGSTGSALTQVAPGSGHTNLQPYIVVNKIIKY